jgi:hypothetical protein
MNGQEIKGKKVEVTKKKDPEEDDEVCIHSILCGASHSC